MQSWLEWHFPIWPLKSPRRSSVHTLIAFHQVGSKGLQHGKATWWMRLHFWVIAGRGTISWRRVIWKRHWLNWAMMWMRNDIYCDWPLRFGSYVLQEAGKHIVTEFTRKLEGFHLCLTKGPYSQSYGFCSSHVWMWQLNHKEGWAPKNGFFWTVVLEKTLLSPLDCKEIKSVNPKGNQPWIFTGSTHAETETLNTLATWCNEPTHWKRPWCGERLNAKGGRDDRGWAGWKASLTQWTWVGENAAR